MRSRGAEAFHETGRGQATVAAGLALLCLLAYANSFPGIFIFDDLDIVVNNPIVTTFDLRGMFTADYWGAGEHSGLYRPLALLSFAANHAVSGPNALHCHAVNVALHVLVTVLLFSYLRALGTPTTPAALAAAVFAVHPVHAEAVDTVVGRTELIVAACALACLLIEMRGLRHAALLTPALFAAALFTKEHGAVIPALLLLSLAFQGGSLAGVLRSRWRTFGLMAAIGIAWLLVRWTVHPEGGIARIPVLPSDNPLAELDLARRIPSALALLLTNLRLILFPQSLGFLYGRADATIIGTLGAGLGVLAIFAAAAALAARLWLRRHLLGLALPFFFVSLLPTANLIVVVGILTAERALYLPSLAVSMGLAALWPKRGRANAVFVALVCCYAAWLGHLALARNPLFSDPEALYESAVTASPGNPRGWYGLGVETGKGGDFAAAQSLFRRGIAADATFPENWSALAVTLLNDGKYEECVAIARETLSRFPDVPMSYPIAAAQAEIELGNLEEAARWLALAEPRFGNLPDFTKAAEAYRSAARGGT